MKFNFNAAKNVVVTMVKKGAFKVKKISPELMIGGGIAIGIAAAVVACKASKHSEQISDEARKELDYIQDKYDVTSHEEYSSIEKHKDELKVYATATERYIKLYWPSAALGMASIALILGSHSIMRTRNANLVAAYSGLSTAFSNYKKKVAELIGDDEEKKIRYGIETEEHKEKDENGKTIKKKESFISDSGDDLSKYSPYARFFDENCKGWENDATYNFTFLTHMQQVANSKFQSNGGHLFLNEVYDLLGMTRTQAGSVVGWVKGAGDDFIDFGIYNVNRKKNLDFINGYEPSILLDFNVDGVIWNKI